MKKHEKLKIMDFRSDTISYEGLNKTWNTNSQYMLKYAKYKKYFLNIKKCVEGNN